MRRLDPYYKTWHGMPYALSKYADVKFYGPGFEGCISSKDIRNGEKIDVLKIINKLYPNDYPDVIIRSKGRITTETNKIRRKVKIRNWCHEPVKEQISL